MIVRQRIKIATIIAAILFSTSLVIILLPNVLEAQKDDIQVINNFILNNATEPSIAYDSKLNKTFSVFFRTLNGSTNLYMMQSGDNGISFSNLTRVNSMEGDTNNSGIAPPIRFSDNGDIYVGWIRIEPTEKFWGIGDLRLAISIDGGASFEKTIKPAKNESISEKLYADLAISNNGTILIPYVDNDLVTINNSAINYNTDEIDWKTQINILRSNDNGKSFQKLVLDKEGCQCCDIATTKGLDGEIYFSWRTSNRTDVTMNDFADKYIEDWKKSDYFDDKNAINQGLIEVPIYSTTRDILVSHTTDNGKGLEYSKPVEVQERNWIMNGCPSTGPGMQFSQDGILHVTYFTGNGTNGPGYYYTYSEDRGDTFKNPIPIHVADFVAITHTNMDLNVDSNNNVWISFVTAPDEAHNNLESYSKNLNIVVIRYGEIVDEKIFESKTISSPSLTSTNNSTLLSYSNGEDVQIISMAVT
ncbi:MAG: sialidase family protein [Nitrososphaeraceae archaeon]